MKILKKRSLLYSNQKDEEIKKFVSEESSKVQVLKEMVRSTNITVKAKEKDI